MIQRFCGNLDCFLVQEKKYESEIPLIYQRQHAHQFYNMLNQKNYVNRIEISKNDKIIHRKALKKTNSDLNNINSQPPFSLSNSRNIPKYNKFNFVSGSNIQNSTHTKENIILSEHKHVSKEFSHNQYDIVINNQLLKSKSQSKLEQNHIKNIYASKVGNQSTKGGAKIQYLRTHQQSYSTDSVNASEYNMIVQNNMNLKKIIQEQYYPLRNCYQSMKNQQRQRAKLIQILQNKVKQLGNELKGKQLKSNIMIMGRYQSLH